MPRSSGSMGGFTNTFGLLMAGRAAIKVLASRIVEEAMTVTPEVVSWWEDELKTGQHPIAVRALGSRYQVQ